MNIFVLLIIVFAGASEPPTPILAGFQDVTTCQTTEGLMLTHLAQTEPASAPVIVNDCQRVDSAKAASLK